MVCRHCRAQASGALIWGEMQRICPNILFEEKEQASLP